MLTEKINLFYSYEEKMKNAIRRSNMAEFEKIRHEAGANIETTLANTEIWQNILQTYFSEDLFNLYLEHNFEASRINEIETNFIERNKKYVEDQLDVDLSNVDIFYLDDSFVTAEGWAMSCKTDEHYVCLPVNLKNNFLSDDLLIHELGHTAEFCIRRNDVNEERLINHKIISETIAHYSQFKYLSTQNRNKRISVIGSILYIAPFLEIFKYCISNNTKNWYSDRAIEAKNFEGLKKHYSVTELFSIIKPYEGTNIYDLYSLVIEPRLGAILALSLLDNKNAIKSLCLADTNKNIKSILDDIGLDSDQLLDFSKADEILKRFIFQS